MATLWVYVSSVLCVRKSRLSAVRSRLVGIVRSRLVGNWNHVMPDQLSALPQKKRNRAFLTEKGVGTVLQANVQDPHRCNYKLVDFSVRFWCMCFFRIQM